MMVLAGQVTVPVLITAGGGSDLLSPAPVRRWKGAVKSDAELINFTDGGHIPHFLAKDSFLPVLLDFLDYVREGFAHCCTQPCALHAVLDSVFWNTTHGSSVCKAYSRCLGPACPGGRHQK